MRRARAARALVGWAPLVLLPLALASCGGGEPSSELSFETLSDTARLSQGAPVLERFEPYRMANGAVRVTGRARLPDGTQLQVAIKEPGGTVSVAMAQAVVQDSQFDTPPLLGDRGPLPEGRYRFEVVVNFNSNWQTPEVMRAIAGGRELRGPGVTRAKNGDPTLFIVREARL